MNEELLNTILLKLEVLKILEDTMKEQFKKDPKSVDLKELDKLENEILALMNESMNI